MESKSWRCPEIGCRKLIEASSERALNESVRKHEKQHDQEEAAEEVGGVVADAASEGFISGLIRTVGKIFD